MRFQSFDALATFVTAARHGNFVTAATKLNRTKGAISYQIKTLEQALGFALFDRHPRGITLTAKGRELLEEAEPALAQITARITRLRAEDSGTITIGTTTYFASRWLSPRLMLFMRAHPNIRLRLQPMIDPAVLRGEHIDIAVRWGTGAWTDQTIEPLLNCPAFATANADFMAEAAQNGLQETLAQATYLRDRDTSDTWSEWHAAANIPLHTRAETLIVPDPNVRVQAVIDGQGIAINDAFVSPELETGTLHRINETELPDYGYFLAYDPAALNIPAVQAFRDWIIETAQSAAI